MKEEIKNKILRAINKGLNEALDIDDFSEDDLKIQKKSLSSIIKDSNYKNNIEYYQGLMNLIMSKYPNITKKDILNCINWYELYGVLYNPHLDGNKFKDFIHYIICKYNNNSVNLNFIDTSEVTDMSYLFYSTYYSRNISNWDVSNVTNMEYMFNDSKFNGDISNWDVSNVINMCAMFCDSSFRKDISSWNINPICNTYDMFAGCHIPKNYKPICLYK